MKKSLCFLSCLVVPAILLGGLIPVENPTEFRRLLVAAKLPTRSVERVVALAKVSDDHYVVESDAFVREVLLSLPTGSVVGDEAYSRWVESCVGLFAEYAKSMSEADQIEMISLCVYDMKSHSVMFCFLRVWGLTSVAFRSATEPTLRGSLGKSLGSVAMAEVLVDILNSGRYTEAEAEKTRSSGNTGVGFGVAVTKSIGSVEEISRILLAPDFALSAANVNALKLGLKDRAVLAARKKLRSEGKSFVSRTVTTTNGTSVSTSTVNPVDVLVKPVVDAINAPAMSGIESAFVSLGVPVSPIDRSSLTNASFRLTLGQLQDGTLVASDNPNYMPKLSIVLGVSEFNKFVQSYNGSSASEVK